MNYRRMILERFKLPESPFEAGFFSIFGLARSPFAEAAEAIINSTPEDAFRQDYEAIAGDFNRVFQQEARLIDGDEFK